MERELKEKGLRTWEEAATAAEDRIAWRHDDDDDDDVTGCLPRQTEVKNM